MEPRFKMHTHTLQAYKEGANKASTVSAWLFPFLLHAPSQPPAGCPVLVRFGVEDSSLHDTMLTLSLERFENSLPWFRKNRRPTSRQIVQICSKIHLSRGATKNATESKHPNPCSQQIAGPGNHSYCIILHIYDIYVHGKFSLLLLLCLRNKELPPRSMAQRSSAWESLESPSSTPAATSFHQEIVFNTSQSQTWTGSVNIKYVYIYISFMNKTYEYQITASSKKKHQITGGSDILGQAPVLIHYLFMVTSMSGVLWKLWQYFWKSSASCCTWSQCQPKAWLVGIYVVLQIIIDHILC